MARRETVYDRLMRFTQEAIRAGEFETPAEVLRRVGKSNGYFGELAGRTAKNPDASIKETTAEAFSRVLGVSLDQIYGRERPAPYEDAFPNRAWAIEAARCLQLPEAAIRAIRRDNPGRDQSRIYWYRRIEAEAERLLPATEIDG